jgi:hypothetical protein
VFESTAIIHLSHCVRNAFVLILQCQFIAVLIHSFGIGSPQFSERVHQFAQGKAGCPQELLKIGHWGNGDYELHVTQEDDLQYVKSLVMQSLKRSSWPLEFSVI